MIDFETLAAQYKEYNRGDITPAEAFGLALTTSIPAKTLLTAIAAALEDLACIENEEAAALVRDARNNPAYEWSV